jgi:hypothetical protein
MSTTFHIHYSIPYLLDLGDRELSDSVTHPDGVEGARAELKSLLNEGITCLVIDASCDNHKEDGSCAGHKN